LKRPDWLDQPRYVAPTGWLCSQPVALPSGEGEQPRAKACIRGIDNRVQAKLVLPSQTKVSRNLAGGRRSLSLELHETSLATGRDTIVQVSTCGLTDTARVKSGEVQPAPTVVQCAMAGCAARMEFTYFAVIGPSSGDFRDFEPKATPMIQNDSHFAATRSPTATNAVSSPSRGAPR